MSVTVYDDRLEIVSSGNLASGLSPEKPPAALWTSPCFELEGSAHFLHVNARFAVPTGQVTAAPLFRVREQLLNDLVYGGHSYGARPGIISL